LNLTTAEHFKQCFPLEDSSKFDAYYFSKASDEDYIIIGVKGRLEDFKVFQKGHYDEESLERRIFTLVSKYGARPQIGTEKLAEKDDEFENQIREDLLRPPKEPENDTFFALLLVILLLIIESIALFLGYIIGIDLAYFPYIISGLAVLNVIIFFTVKTPRARKDDEIK
jgi:hypothetical protein